MLSEKSTICNPLHVLNAEFVGEMSDLLNALGGSTILSECNELLGTEGILARRAVNEDVAKKIYNAIYDIEDVLRSGLDNTLDAKRNQLISPGNFDGGVSSIVEKALGGMHKSGTAKIVDVIDYAVRPPEGKLLKGFCRLCTNRKMDGR